MRRTLGFTLIELLVVILVLAATIVFSVAYPPALIVVVFSMLIALEYYVDGEEES